MSCRVPCEEAAGLARRQKEWGDMWTRAFIVVSVGRNRQGKQV